MTEIEIFVRFDSNSKTFFSKIKGYGEDHIAHFFFRNNTIYISLFPKGVMRYLNRSSHDNVKFEQIVKKAIEHEVVEGLMTEIFVKENKYKWDVNQSWCNVHGIPYFCIDGDFLDDNIAWINVIRK